MKRKTNKRCTLKVNKFKLCTSEFQVRLARTETFTNVCSRAKLSSKFGCKRSWSLKQKRNELSLRPRSCRNKKIRSLKLGNKSFRECRASTRTSSLT